jgi:hypothetical protein
MKPISVSRRLVLGGLLVSPLASLSGCGGGNGSGSAAAGSNTSTTSTSDDIVPAADVVSTPGQVKPVVVHYIYDLDRLQSVEKNLNTVPQNVTTTPDRFNDGALCNAFAGAASQVTVDATSSFPTRDFAIFFWSQTTSETALTALKLTGIDGGVVVIASNSQGLVKVSHNDVVIAQTAAQHSATPSSATWQHVVVQQIGTQLQIYVDGISEGSFAQTHALPQITQIVVGGGWEGTIDDVRIYNRGFSAASIPQSVYQWRQVKPLSMFDNLAGFFPFNGNAQNALGYGNEGIPFNVTPTTDRWGASNAAYLFDGVSSYIELNQPFVSTAGYFGFSFWERSSSSAPMTAFSATSGGVAGSSIDVVFNEGSAIQVNLNGAPLAGLSSGVVGALTDGKWHYILLQRDGSTMQLYVDGVLVASAQSDAILFSENSVTKLGTGSRAGAAAWNYWNGALDDLQLFESPSLTAAHVAAAGTLQFIPRDGAGALTFQGKMWLLGGWNPVNQPDTDSEVWSSPDGVNWTFVTVAPWERRHDAGYAVFNDRMWIVGGDRNTGHYQNNVWSSADGATWELVTDTVPWANRATQYVFAFNDRLWLMGGQQILETPGQPVIAYNDVYSSVDGANWELATPHAAWSPRGLIMNNVVFENRMWVIGGGTYDIRTFNNDVWSSPDGITWTQVLADAPWTPRQFHNTTVFDNKIWVFAGGDAASQGGLNDVWYSPNGVDWVQLLGTPWVARHAASAFVNKNYLWFTCGSDAQAYNDVWKLGYGS